MDANEIIAEITCELSPEVKIRLVNNTILNQKFTVGLYKHFQIHDIVVSPFIDMPQEMSNIVTAFGRVLSAAIEAEKYGLPYC